MTTQNSRPSAERHVDATAAAGALSRFFPSEKDFHDFFPTGPRTGLEPGVPQPFDDWAFRTLTCLPCSELTPAGLARALVTRPYVPLVKDPSGSYAAFMFMYSWASPSEKYGYDHPEAAVHLDAQKRLQLDLLGLLESFEQNHTEISRLPDAPLSARLGKVHVGCSRALQALIVGVPL